MQTRRPARTPRTGRPPLHGHRSKGRITPEYLSWKTMKSRVTNPNNPDWKYYGGRGITAYQEWLADFMAFFRDMGPRPAGTTLDRIDNDGNYEPGNCRWADPAAQVANRRPMSPRTRRI